MRLGLVIATYRRPDILKTTLTHLFSQPHIPDHIVISAVNSTDIPDLGPHSGKVQVLFGSAGLTAQRNKGLGYLIQCTDVIAFIDDDFIVGKNYFLSVKNIFAQNASIVGATGVVIADGAQSGGLAFEEGVRLVDEFHSGEVAPTIWDVRGTYGCNMAFRTASIGPLRFDERLPLYGWQEDMDFSGALRHVGRITKTTLFWGVHLGTKNGKHSEVRLGYSQIINPAYIWNKGNMSFAYALRLSVKNLLANIVKSICPESYVDRRGRLRGNAIGVFYLLTGRLLPEHILDMK
jgi:GT2 family glycosyltransferase